ncbi:TPA: hypothetical protein N2356_002190 [Escherichia coli]|nr:hypothetical protein [Escherichia coli]EFO2522493.1 hypothetical protein [Escherichia coli]EFO2550967.1 hypothetical protein [Escherichia coli]EFO2697374.1 hypothetical protein [Escherichia coli]HCL9714089.1 hypothetical protein [Escherichia coli]
MAKAWKDVIASPQYQALAPEQKAQAQEQYFNEVVAPQAGENAEQATGHYHREGGMVFLSALLLQSA